MGKRVAQNVTKEIIMIWLVKVAANTATKELLMTSMDRKAMKRVQSVTKGPTMI